MWHFDTRTDYFKRFIKGEKKFLFSQVENVCSQLAEDKVIGIVRDDETFLNHVI